MWSIRVAQLVIFGFVWIAIASSQTNKPNQGPTSREAPDPEGLLIRSYLISKDFTPSELLVLLKKILSAQRA